MTAPAVRPVLYLKAGSIPADWKSYRVLYANGRPVRDVVEANSHAGWFVQAIREKGELMRDHGGRLRTRRVEAKIRIERI